MAQWDIPSLNFSSLARTTINLGPIAGQNKSTQAFRAASGLPPVKFRIYNAAKQQGLVLASDAPIGAVVPAGTGMLDRARLASPVNSRRYTVLLSSDDVRSNASYHDSWTLTPSPPPSSASNNTAPTYRVETTSFDSAKDHPYALQINTNAKGADGSLLMTGSSTGSDTSELILLDASSGGFYIYNSQTHTLLAAANPGSTLSDKAVVAETFASFLTRKDDKRFLWHLFLDEDVPSAQNYRIFHSSIKSAGDAVAVSAVEAGSSALSQDTSLGAAAIINPAELSQSWTVMQKASNRRGFGGTTSFSIVSQPGSKPPWPLGGSDTKSWRLIRIPSPTDTVTNQWLIFNETMNSFLKYDTSSLTIQLISHITLDQLILEAMASSPTSPNTLAPLVWKLVPATQVLKSGQYQFFWNDRYLAQAEGGNLPPLLADRNESDGSQWWNVDPKIADNGSLYYRIANFMTADRLEIKATGANVGGSEGMTGGRLSVEAEGSGAVITTVDSSSIILAVDATGDVIVQARDPISRWQIISRLARVRPPVRTPTLKPKVLSLDTWSGTTTQTTVNSNLRPLEDGVYTISNESTKRIVTVGGSAAEGSIRLSDPAKFDASLTTFWRVKRLIAYQDPIYIVRAFAGDSVVTEDTSQPLPLGADGATILDRRTDDTPPQLWIIEPKTNFSCTVKSSQKPALLEDISLLSDGTVNSTLRISPILSTVKSTQKWSFIPKAPSIASGIYRFRFSNSKLLRVALSRDSLETDLISSFNTIRLATRRDGLYTIEFMTSSGLHFLSCDPNSASRVLLSQRADDRAKWELVSTGPETPGYYIQHPDSNFALRFNDLSQVASIDSRGSPSSSSSPYISARLGPRIVGGPDFILNVEITPRTVPTVTNTEAVPSSKIQPGVYRILTSRSTYLTVADDRNAAPPSIPKSKVQVTAVSAAASSGSDIEWTIQQTGNGFYTLTSKRSNLSLCTAINIAEKPTWPFAPSYPSNLALSFSPTNSQWGDNDVIAVTPPYDATRWKLLVLPSGAFNIISKTTEGILQIDPAGTKVSVNAAVPFPALASLTLIRQGDAPSSLSNPLGALPKPMVNPVTLKENPQNKGALISREVDIEAGVFSLEVFTAPSERTGPDPRLCLTLPESDINGRAPQGVSDPRGVRARVQRMDTSPYSLDVGLHLWKIVKDDEGWYAVENYIRGGWKLATIFDTVNGKRVFRPQPADVALIRPGPGGPAAGAATAQWKFVQLDGRYCVVNRACDEYFLSPSGAVLGLRKFGEGASPFCWMIPRASNANAGLQLADGVYSMSVGRERSTLGTSLTSIGLAAIDVPLRKVTADGSFFLTANQTTPPSIAVVDANNLPLLTTQMWFFTRVPSQNPTEYSYKIMSLSTRTSLVNGGSSLTLAQLGSTWQLIPVGSLYAVLNVAVNKQRVVIGQKKSNIASPPVGFFSVDEIASDVKGDIRYLWDLTREGVFIQGAHRETLHSALTVGGTSSGVVASGFKPANALRQAPESRRAMWQIDFKRDASLMQLVNEHTMSPMARVDKSIVAQPIQMGPTSMTGQTNMWVQSVPKTHSSKFLGFEGSNVGLGVGSVGINYSGPALELSSPAAKFNQWNFVPIASVLAGPLVTLPKLGLAPGELKQLAAVDDMKNTVLCDATMARKNETQLGAYTPGVPECRFRLIRYGSLFIALSDSSRLVVFNDTNRLVRLDDVRDAGCWFLPSGSKVAALMDLQPKFWQILVNIGDVAERLQPWYIVLGLSTDGFPIVLSQSNGNVTAVPYDPFDFNQLWKYYDWGSTVKSRVIIHSATARYLTTDLTLISDLSLDPLTQTYSIAVAKSISWTIDVDCTLALQNAGLARHMYINNASFTPPNTNKKHLDLSGSDRALRPALVDDPPIEALGDIQFKRGCRFVPAPRTFDLSTRSLIIDNIIRANAPVFVHHRQCYLPIDVGEYLKRATITSPTGESMTPIIDEFLIDTSKRDWALSWTPPSSESMPNPAVYVRVLRSHQVVMTGKTEVEYSVFYPPIRDVHGSLVPTVHGWVKVALRLDNDTGAVDSALFNGNKRIGNTSTSFANVIDPKLNPLCWRLTPAGARRLHVFLSSDTSNPLLPSCPTSESPDLPNFVDWRTADGKSGALDASTCYKVLEADMMKSDDLRPSPQLPPWAEFRGRWSLIAQNPLGPLFPSSLEWSARDQDLGLEAARRLSEDAEAKKIAADAAQADVSAMKVSMDAMKRDWDSLSPSARAQYASMASGYKVKTIQADALSKAANESKALVPVSVVLSRANWTVTASSFQPFYEPANILSGDNKLWHTQWDPNLDRYPHTLTIDMGTVRLLNGLTYRRRPDLGVKGVIGKFSVDVSMDGGTWTSPVAAGTWLNDNNLNQTLTFGPSLARFVRLSALTELFGLDRPWASCGGITLTADPGAEKQRQALETLNMAQASERASAQSLYQQDAESKKSTIAQVQNYQTAIINATQIILVIQRDLDSFKVSLAARTNDFDAALRNTSAAQENFRLVNERADRDARVATDALNQAPFFEKLSMQMVLSRVVTQNQQRIEGARVDLQAKQQAQGNAESAKNVAQVAVSTLESRLTEAQRSKSASEASLQKLQATQANPDLVAVIDAAVFAPTDPNCPLPNARLDVTDKVRQAWARFVSDPANTVPGSGRTCTIPATNAYFGKDPAPYFVKRVDILFRVYLRSNPVITTRVRTVTATENTNALLSLDVATGDQAVELLDGQAQARARAFRLGGGDLQYALVAATYGPKDVLDRVKTFLNDASRANNGKEKWPFAFVVGNAEMGGDPTPYVVKTCRVLFRAWKNGAGKEVEGSVYKEVRALEGQTVVVG